MPLLDISDQEWEDARVFFSQTAGQIKFSKDAEERHSFIKIGDEIYALASKKYAGEEHYGALGEGGFGKVKVAQNASGESYAVKIEKRALPEFDPDEAAQHALMEKIDYLKKSVIRERDKHDAKRKYKSYKITELYEGSDLFESLFDKNLSFTETEKYIIALKACEALAYLHAQNIIHADVKAENFMLNRIGEQIILSPIDFDFSLLATQGEAYFNKARGTPQYAAPELLQGPSPNGLFRYSFESDIYSLGMMFKNILNLPDSICDDMLAQLPEKRSSLSDVKGKIAEKLYLKMANLSPEMQEIVLKYKKEKEEKDQQASLIKFQDDLKNALSLRTVSLIVQNMPFILQPADDKIIDPQMLAEKIESLVDSPDKIPEIEALLEGPTGEIDPNSIENKIFEAIKRTKNLQRTKESDQELFYQNLSALSKHDDKARLLDLIKMYPHDIEHISDKKKLIENLESIFEPKNIEIYSKYGDRAPIFRMPAARDNNSEIQRAYKRILRAICENKKKQAEAMKKEIAAAEKQLEKSINAADDLQALIKIIEDYPHPIADKTEDNSRILTFLKSMLMNEDNLKEIHEQGGDHPILGAFDIEEKHGLLHKVVEIAEKEYQRNAQKENLENKNKGPAA